jgi:predicted TIM-barrel fold metal-dependent hydrolase
MIGNMEVIDAHCPIYPEKIAARAVAHTDAFYGTKGSCNGTTASLLEMAEKGRIDRFLVHSVATTPEQVKSINKFISNEVKTHPHRFFGFGTLHPESADISGDFEHLLELGLQGVKIHPDIQAFKADDHRCLKIYELCEDAGVPILIHTGDPRYDFSNPNRIKPILEIYKNLTVIGAHMGGWSVWDEAYETLSPFPNFYVDCSSSFNFHKKERIKDLICAWGFERVLFGSDYPMWNPEKELDILLSFDLGEKANRLILGENAKRLFRLEAV